MEKEDLLNESMELNKKMVDLMLSHSIKCSQIFIEGYEKQLELKNKFLADLLDDEPIRFFKKSHDEWKQKIKELEKEIEDIERKLYEEHSLVGESLSLLNS